MSWTGTDGPSAYLSVPAAIDFQTQNHWPAVQAACHRLLLEVQHRILELSDQEPLSPDSTWIQMCSIPLPGRASDYKELWNKYQIVAPVLERNEKALIRISIQAYNTPEHLERLLQALTEISRGV